MLSRTLKAGPLMLRSQMHFGLFQAFIHFQVGGLAACSSSPLLIHFTRTNTVRRGFSLKYRCSVFVEEAIEHNQRQSFFFFFSVVLLFIANVVKGLVAGNRNLPQSVEKGLTKGQECYKVWKLGNDAARNCCFARPVGFRTEAPACDWRIMLCRCPGDDTVSVPLYQSLPPLPTWPPLDWRKRFCHVPPEEQQNRA